MSYYTLQNLKTIAGLCQGPATLMLTASNWADICREISEDPSIFTDKGRLPTPQNFKRLQLRLEPKVLAVNSGTEDTRSLDIHNRIEEEKSGFLWAKQRYAQRKGTKPTPEAEDAEATHEVDEALKKEAYERELVKRGERGLKLITGGKG
jgi:hypothetical protein